MPRYSSVSPIHLHVEEETPVHVHVVAKGNTKSPYNMPLQYIFWFSVFTKNVYVGSGPGNASSATALNRTTSNTSIPSRPQSRGS